MRDEYLEWFGKRYLELRDMKLYDACERAWKDGLHKSYKQSYEETINAIENIEIRIGVAASPEYIKDELRKIINRGRFLLK